MIPSDLPTQGPTLPDLPPALDPQEVERALRILFEQGQVFEIRALKCKPPGGRGRAFTSAGWFNDPAKAAAAVAALDARTKPKAIYFTLNPCNAQLLARGEGPNKLEDYAEETTTDAQILHRRWLLVDLDPSRVSGISSTEAELAAAIETARAIGLHLETQHGWPEPVRAKSGNGAHLLYRIGLPNDEVSAQLLKAVLHALAGIKVEGVERVEVDVSVYNASRIDKLYGSIARKGAHTVERPHRLSTILEAPKALTIVPLEKLQAVAALAPVEPKKRAAGNGEAKQSRSGASTSERLRAAATPERVVEFFASNGVSDLAPSGQDGWIKGRLDGHGGFSVHPPTRSYCDHKDGDRTGGLVDFLVRHRGLDDRTAGRMVAEFFGIAEERPKRRKRSGAPLPNVSSLGASDLGDGAIVKQAHERRAHVLRNALTDLGNAEILLRLHGKDLHYIHLWARWLCWDDTRWASDQAGRARLLAADVSAVLYQEAARLFHEATAIVPSTEEEQEAKERLEEQATNTWRWASTSEGDARVTAMLNMMESEPKIPSQPGDLDRDPWLLNCMNGTLDLKTGELRPHRREDLVSKRTSVQYDPMADCPRWLAFLAKVMGNSPEMIAFLQRAVGYSLTGMTREQCLFLLHGTGANGKSTFLEVLRELFADYCEQADFGTFLEKKNDQIRNDVARLRGARLVSAVEVAESRRLDEPLIKRMTGGDTVTARFLYGEFFEYVPTFKLWLAANHKPVIRGTDNAIWRRVNLVPFDVTIPPEEQDRDLAARLRLELPGILAWAVRGCLDWQQGGLRAPTEVVSATDTYRQESDLIGHFLDEECVLEKSATAKAGDLYRAYTEWAEAAGERPTTQAMFGRQLGERGLIRGKSGGRLWRGIRLLHASAISPDPFGSDGEPTAETSGVDGDPRASACTDSPTAREGGQAASVEAIGARAVGV